MFSIGIYAISDLHLSTGTDKSMEVFGPCWSGYMERIRENWLETVSAEDTVVIGGDVSWAMRLRESLSDFEFINDLPGKKIIFKGNHDYWWETVSKLNSFVAENKFKDIYFVNNNAFEVSGVAICGTRWWSDPSSGDFKQADLKIYNHELLRLEASLKEAARLNCEKTLVVLHYPPFSESLQLNDDISRLFKSYNVSACLYGHLHGAGQKNAVSGEIDGVRYIFTAADHLKFTPLKISL